MSCKLEQVIRELYELKGRVSATDNADKEPRLEQLSSLIAALETEAVGLSNTRYERTVDEEAGKPELVDNGQLELDFSIGGATKQVFDAWKYATEVEQLQGRELQERVKSILKNAGVEFTTADGNVYNLGAEVLDRGFGNKINGKEANTTPMWEVVTQEFENNKFKGWEVDLQVRERAKKSPSDVVINRLVELNPNKYLQPNGQITVVNSIPMKLWPEQVHSKVKAFTEAISNTLPKLDKADVNSSAKFYLHDTPAIGLLFGNVNYVNGETSYDVSPAVSAAMYMSLLDNISNSRSKMLPGLKSDEDVSDMFGVSLFEVTPAMREFANGTGVLVKTLASDIGKDVLTKLGLTKKAQEGVSKDQYEAMIASLGHVAIEAGITQGLLELDKVSSNTLAEMYKKGQKWSVDTKTSFVKIANIGSKPTNSVVAEFEAFDEISKMLPEVKTKQKGPLIRPLSDEQIEESLQEVRHDVTGVHSVPEDAKKALRTMMKTPYLVEVDRIKSFLNMFDSNRDNILTRLWYINNEPLGEIDGKPVYDPKFEKLTYENRLIQEAINRDILFSIDHLRKLVDGKTEDFEVYYKFYYTGNGRYMMDSNTVNPQTDKLHRFLLQPKAHKLTHKVNYNKLSPGKTTFEVDGKDTSYYVRVALSQAFGVGIDKSSTKDIIALGNALLMLNNEQLDVLEEQLLTTGKSSVKIGPKNSYTLDQKIETEHLSHTLQALDFLRQVRSGSVTSSLTAEYDSLTSGFANKVQQFPILGAGNDSIMDVYWARVGIITDSYKQNAEAGSLFGGIEGVNKLLSGEGAKKGFLDSYKNLAAYVTARLFSVAGELVGKDKGFFDTVFEYLPGAKGEIDSAMRSLFKKPFMIFNYSAGIESISRNISYDLGTKVLDELASGNTKLAQSLLDGKFIGNKEVTTANELVEFVRNNPADKLLLVVADRKFDEGKMVASPTATKTVPFYDGAKDVFGDVYGELVKNAFNENFSDFIKIQDLTNSAFKISFRLFEDKFNAAIEAVRADKKTVTDADVSKLLEDLWQEFPWIKGPLTKNVGDVIPVFAIDTKTPEAPYANRKAPQTRLSTNTGHKSEKVNILVKHITEAVNAGSVLPFHYIDGAELGGALNEFVEYLMKHTGDSSAIANSGILPVHDAVIPPLDKSDEIIWFYNKTMHETNRDYSLIDALQDMVNRWPTEYDKELSIDGLKVLDDGLNTRIKLTRKGKAEVPVTFMEVVRAVAEDINRYQSVIKDFRDVMNVRMQSATVSNMVGTIGGMYRVGSTGPDMSYNEKVKKNYQSYRNLVVGDMVIAEQKPQVLGSELNSAIMGISNLAKECK